MDKPGLIKQILRRGGAGELRDLLLGVSTYNDKDVRSSVPEQPPLRLTRLVNMARNHLDFISRFDADRDHVIEGKAHYFAYNSDFEQWLAEGAPGISESELERLSHCSRSG